MRILNDTKATIKMQRKKFTLKHLKIEPLVDRYIQISNIDKRKTTDNNCCLNYVVMRSSNVALYEKIIVVK